MLNYEFNWNYARYILCGSHYNFINCEQCSNIRCRMEYGANRYIKMTINNMEKWNDNTLINLNVLFVWVPWESIPHRSNVQIVHVPNKIRLRINTQREWIYRSSKPGIKWVWSMTEVFWQRKMSLFSRLGASVAANLRSNAFQLRNHSTGFLNSIIRLI